MPPARFITVHWLADLLAAAAVVGMLALLVLWSRSHYLGGDEQVFDAPGGRLHVCSRDGRLIVGVFQQAQQRRWWTPPRSPMSELINDDAQFILIDIRGWGVALPHAALAAVLGIVPAWWWFVHRAGSERDRRRAQGLCRECGYDLRAASVRCPECGTPIAPGVGRLEKFSSVWRAEPRGGDADDTLRTRTAAAAADAEPRTGAA